MENKYCNACDKNLTYTNSKNQIINLIGFQITVAVENKDDKEHLQKQLGKYKLGKEYNVCWECWLKNIGLKP